MRPQYIHLNGFTVVLTPHFLEQAHLRGLKGHMMPAIHFERAWSVTPQLQVCGYAINGGYAYCRKIWNDSRNRWELEYISFTPATHFHTDRLKHALMVIV